MDFLFRFFQRLSSRFSFLEENESITFAFSGGFIDDDVAILNLTERFEGRCEGFARGFPREAINEQFPVGGVAIGMAADKGEERGVFERGLGDEIDELVS